MGRLPSSNFHKSFDDQAAHRPLHGLIEPMWERIVFLPHRMEAVVHLWMARASTLRAQPAHRWATEPLSDQLSDTRRTPWWITTDAAGGLQHVEREWQAWISAATRLRD